MLGVFLKKLGFDFNATAKQAVPNNRIAPKKPLVVDHAQAATKLTAKPATKPTSKVAAKAAVVKTSVKPPTKPPTKSPTKPPSQTALKAPVKTAAKAIAKVAVKAVVEPAAKTAPKQISKPIEKVVVAVVAAKSVKPAQTLSKPAPKSAKVAVPIKITPSKTKPAPTQAIPVKLNTSPKLDPKPAVKAPTKATTKVATKTQTPAVALPATPSPKPMSPALTAALAPKPGLKPLPKPSTSASKTKLKAYNSSAGIAQWSTPATYMPASTLAPPPAAVHKRDPKRANNWKTVPIAQLVDDDIMAMSDAEYMNDTQFKYFRKLLVALRTDMLKNAGETTEHLREETVVTPDPTDRATIEEEHALELRTRDRERKLLKKIEQSISRIDSEDYGYCDETGEPIGVPRLLARPTANLSLEAQQRRELRQKMFGD